MKIKKGTGSYIFDIVNYAVLLVVGFITLYPLYFAAITSLSSGEFVLKGMVKIFPKGINFEVYRLVFENPDIWRSYGNTILYTIVGTFINISFSAMCAYPLSRKDFYGRYVFIIIIAFTMFFSGGLIPSYLLVDKLGMVNTIWALVLPGAIGTMNMIIMRTFFQSIPESLQESAYIDGANDILILLRIILPLSIPILATMVLFYAVGHWNSFFSALIFLNEKKKYPVQIILRNIVVAGEFGSEQGRIGADTELAVIATNYKYAVIMITVIPILMIYPFIQKYFAKGVMIGAIKG